MNAPPRQILLALLGGSAALVVVHALGRFAFTPLLPHFLADGLFDLQQASRLATWNYVGYLLGALLALALHSPARLHPGLILALLSNALLTLAQCFASDYALLLLLRLANGISNGVVFVLAPALVLEWLASRQRAGLSGLVYLGFAAGLLLSNGLANWPAESLAGPGAGCRWPPWPYRWPCSAPGCSPACACRRARPTVPETARRPPRHCSTAPARRCFSPMPAPVSATSCR